MYLTKVIITAMKEEAEIIIEKFNLKQEKKIKNIIIYEWFKKINSKSIYQEKEKIVLALSGIWKIQSAITATYLFENYLIDKLINIWIAWNLDNLNNKVWDVFMPNTFIQHDMYLPFEWQQFDYLKKPIFLKNISWKQFDLNKFSLVLNWVCLTWDQFIDNEEQKNNLKQKFDADICEMEAFSILSVANQYDSLDKCIIIKAISDGADNKSKKELFNNLKYAMLNSIAILELVI